jgi:hypothetical protein
VNSLCHRAPAGNLFLRVNAWRARITLTARTYGSTFRDDERCGTTLRIVFNIKRRGLVARSGPHSRQGAVTIRSVTALNLSGVKRDWQFENVLHSSVVRRCSSDAAI